MKRRQFIQTVCAGTCGLVAGGLAAGPVAAAPGKFHREAHHYETLPDGKVRCLLCPHGCVVEDGERGFCRVRENIDGKYYTIVYGSVCAKHIDPIEKKPFFHFLPGTIAFSIATVGCNMRCKFCQNWEISQEKPENAFAVAGPPAGIAAEAVKWDCPTIAYTYTEPIVYSEFAMDCAREGHKSGVRSVVVSAGYINPDPLRDMAAVMDAIKIDLKAYSDDFYRDICSASLRPVLKTIETVRETGTWLEIVNLIVPTLNDDDKMIDDLCKWVVENVGDDVPIHFTRFYPTYKLENLPPTPVADVERAREIALARGVKFPYVGNVPAGHPGESTYCPECGNTVIKRAGYVVLDRDLDDGKCAKCGTEIPGVWS